MIEMPGNAALAIIAYLTDPVPFPVRARRDERALGHSVVRPGEMPWLPRRDWYNDAVVSIDHKRKEVRIVLVRAKEPGSGAFRRLIGEILCLELEPVVVCPLGEMTDILKRWGWRHTMVGDSFQTRQNEWRRP